MLESYVTQHGKPEYCLLYPKEILFLSCAEKSVEMDDLPPFRFLR
jgi:hypothetical protein